MCAARMHQLRVLVLHIEYGKESMFRYRILTNCAPIFCASAPQSFCMHKFYPNIQNQRFVSNLERAIQGDASPNFKRGGHDFAHPNNVLVYKKRYLRIPRDVVSTYAHIETHNRLPDGGGYLVEGAIIRIPVYTPSHPRVCLGGVERLVPQTTCTLTCLHEK